MNKRWDIIPGVTVTQEDDGRVHWESGATIDADGANGQNGNRFAYRLDNQGLDDIHGSAGYPDYGWRNVLLNDGAGHPLTDANGNCYSSTTYYWPGHPVATRYVDATAVPYVVVNPILRMAAEGIVIGCNAIVTWNGSQIDAVGADIGVRSRIGEISIAAATALGFQNSNPRNGGVDSGVLFEFWPGQPATINGETYRLQPAGLPCPATQTRLSI